MVYQISGQLRGFALVHSFDDNVKDARRSINKRIRNVDYVKTNIKALLFVEY